MINLNIYNFRDTFFNGNRESASDSDDDSESEGKILNINITKCIFINHVYIKMADQLF